MKTIYTIILFLWITILVKAQIDLEINNNMQVETSGGLFIEVSGDVVENGTGYLKGAVTSGTRSGETNFAGLTFGSSFTGTIKRTTGTALSASNPKTFLRSYELNNTGSALNTTVQSKFVSSGSNDEENGITTPFIYKKVTTNWTGHNNTSIAANLVSAANVNIPTGSSNITVAEGIGVAAKIYLQGPYSTSANNMSLSINGSIPAVSPYSEDPRTAQNIPANAVDWVLVKLRNSSNPFAVVASRSAFVNGDGNIIDDFGNLHTGIPASITGLYNISVKHRNHLEIMTQTAQNLNWESN
ncbi:MAG: hypothetical protein WAR79_03035 [Melioribacteraceae bacterium]